VTIQAIFIALFAILGALLRIIIAQLFGEACANPGTVAWLSAGEPLCVTKMDKRKNKETLYLPIYRAIYYVPS
jgi:hypothetical protein